MAQPLPEDDALNLGCLVWSATVWEPHWTLLKASKCVCLQDSADEFLDLYTPRGPSARIHHHRNQRPPLWRITFLGKPFFEPAACVIHRSWLTVWSSVSQGEWRVRHLLLSNPNQDGAINHDMRRYEVYFLFCCPVYDNMRNVLFTKMLISFGWMFKKNLSCAAGREPLVYFLWQFWERRQSYF